MLGILVAVLAVVVSTATATLSSSCLHAICEIESGCTPLDCRFGAKGETCGYYQIPLNYYKDCHSPGQSWRSCALDKFCADQCVREYLSRFGSYCTKGKTPTCEDYARIHNGGPNGCFHPNTLGFWNNVSALVSE